MDNIATEYHQQTIQEYEALRDHLYLQKIMSEADVDPHDQSVYEPKHWTKVETMFEVMDKKDSAHRGKEHIERAIKNMHHGDFLELLKQVKLSLSKLHNKIDLLSYNADNDINNRSFQIQQDDLQHLYDLDQFISPQLANQAKQISSAQRIDLSKKSRASVLIERKDDVLQSLQQSMTNISTLHDKGLQILNTSTTNKTDEKDNEKNENDKDKTPEPKDLTYTGSQNDDCPEAILHTPESMKERRQNRRDSLINIGIDDEETHNAKPPEKFVEDVLLQKIDELQVECDEWKAKYRALTSQHRRLSLEQGEIVKALKNSDVLNGNERLASITNNTSSEEIGTQTDAVKIVEPIKEIENKQLLIPENAVPRRASMIPALNSIDESESTENDESGGDGSDGSSDLNQDETDKMIEQLKFVQSQQTKAAQAAKMKRFSLSGGLGALPLPGGDMKMNKSGKNKKLKKKRKR